MAEENMARVKVTKNVTVMPNKTSTVLYRNDWEGTAPRAHIEQIVAAGAGEAVAQPEKQLLPQQTSGPKTTV